MAPRPRAVVKLRFADAGYPNPFTYLPFGYGIVSHIYDTLLLRDSAGDLLPWLAAGHEVSPDGSVHRFALRENVAWHDGRPFTAADVVFSFEYFAAREAEGKVAPWVLFKPEHVQRVRQVGSRGIEIKLDRPAVTFTRTVAGRFPIIPRHIWSSLPDPRMDGGDLRLFVGTGPYRLDKYGFGQGYAFTANDSFFLGAPFVREVRYVPASDETAALQTGDIDAGSVQGTSGIDRVLRRLASNPKFGILEFAPDFVTALNWNIARGGPLADVRFRQACALAIDRSDIVERVFGGVGQPGNPGFLPRGHPFHADVEQYRFNRGAADRLLDKAGYRRGRNGVRMDRQGRPLRFSLVTPPQLHATVEVVIDALEAVGVQLKVRVVDRIVMIKDNYDLALVFYGGVASEDPDYMRRVYSSLVGDKLFMAARGYANAEFDDLAERQLVTVDEVDRRRMLARMQQIVAEDIPLLHLCYSGGYLVFRKELFDGWINSRRIDDAGPLGKQALVTGVATGGTKIRRTT